MARLLRSALLASAALVLIACGGSSPTAPSAPIASEMRVATEYGIATVRFTEQCATSSETKIRVEIGQGYTRAIREAPEAADVPVEPLSILVMGQRPTPVWYFPPDDRVEYGCGDEGGIEHEMGHRIAHYLGRSCSREVWHTVDLNCRPL